MNLHRFLILGFLALAPIHAAEIVTLSVTAPQSGSYASVYSSASINLAPGDVATVVSSCKTDGGSSTSVAIQIGAVEFIPYTGDGPMVIAGPATLRCKASGSPDSGSSAFFTASVTRANTAPSQTPANAVVIPANASGNIQIALESSADMVTWTAANPGSYSSSTQNRFFRVRAIAP